MLKHSLSAKRAVCAGMSLAMSMGLILSNGILSAPVAAAEAPATSVFCIDGTGAYTTLEDAVAHASDNDTIRMLTNTSLDDTVVIGKNITLKLDGFTLTKNVANTADYSEPAIQVAGGANVTIKDGTIKNNITYKSNTGVKTCLVRVGKYKDEVSSSLKVTKDVVLKNDIGNAISFEADNCKLDFDGKIMCSGKTLDGVSCNDFKNLDVTFGEDSDITGTVFVAKSNGTIVNINGSIKGLAGIVTTGNTDATKIEINKGSSIKGSGVGILSTGTNTVIDVNGGTITADCPIACTNGGNIFIYDGVLEAVGLYESDIVTDYMSGNAINFLSDTRTPARSTTSNHANLFVAGGKLISKNGYAVCVQTKDSKEPAIDGLSILGGEFSGKLGSFRFDGQTEDKFITGGVFAEGANDALDAFIADGYAASFNNNLIKVSRVMKAPSELEAPKQPEETEADKTEDSKTESDVAYSKTDKTDKSEQTEAAKTDADKIAESNKADENADKKADEADSDKSEDKAIAETTIGKITYRILDSEKKTAEVAAASSKIKNAVIKDKVNIGGKSYKVTSIADNAFKGCKKIAKITIGKNVVSVGKAAFSGCKTLKSVVIKGSKITKVSKNAFKGIDKAAAFKCPKKQAKSFKKLISRNATGFKKTMTVK